MNFLATFIKYISNLGSMSNDKIVVTAALPYANGPIHLGSLLEYIQTDIFVRFLKLTGENALYICASDMHGAPIEINAKKAGIDPEKFVENFWKEHQADFKKFLVQFDNFHKTHSKENRELSELFFNTLREKKLIYTKEMEQMYDKEAKRFLPDRFVKGTCPKCQAEDQYGDICENCGATYDPVNLIDPYSTITNSKPVIKKSTHYFFKLSSFSEDLEKWLFSEEANVQEEIKNQLKEWLDKGLQDWCISRDEPYFGFEIPNSKKETGAKKYFYVWLDAPIGYISSTKNYCDKHGGKWEDYWRNGKVYSIIGKDIVYFHYLFWPAMLMAMEIRLPEFITHGFLTVNGQKMSKSRGTFITAKEYLKDYPPEALRFYYASRLDRKVIDLDLNFDDFIAVNNNVLMGNLGNFCYRVLTFANKNYGDIKVIAEAEKIEQEVKELVEKIEKSYQKLDFRSAVTNILAIADLGNAYFQNHEPWKNKEKSEGIVGFCVNLARNLAILASPVLPEFSKKIAKALGEKLTWDISFDWAGKVGNCEKLVEKIEKVEEFQLDLRVGKIIKVTDHPNADSLYMFDVDFGEFKRQVVTSLKKQMRKEEFEGKKIVFCLNLKPAKFRGEESNAMILAAEGKKIVLLEMSESELGEIVAPEGMHGLTEMVEFKEFEKVKMEVLDGHVIFNGKKLKSSSQDVIVDVKDGSKVR
jgi:methionyl-tRNA synthetase